jgi:hypothetical protein
MEFYKIIIIMAPRQDWEKGGRPSDEPVETITALDEGDIALWKSYVHLNDP